MYTHSNNLLITFVKKGHVLKRGLSTIPALIIATTIAMCAAVLTASMINYKRAAELKLEYRQKVALIQIRATETQRELQVQSVGPRYCKFVIQTGNRNITIVVQRGRYKIVHGILLYCPKKRENPHIAEPSEQ